MPLSLRKTTLMTLAVLGSHFVNAQEDHKDQDHDHRTCATMEVMEEEHRQNPQLAKQRADMERNIQQYIANTAGQRTSATVITIPVVVHVVYNNATQNISDAQIQSQIDILNADFGRTNTDVSLTPSLFTSVIGNAEIQFCLAKRTPAGLYTTGITRTYTNTTSFSQNNAVKSSATGGVDPWDPTKYLNIWVCELGGGLLGYAQFPGGSNATDGVVCGHFCFGSNGTAASPYNKGRTMTHEVGHWLNLRHIWGDANCGDDLVSDTPTQQASNGGCPSYPHPSCSNTSDMFMNYMDYTNDACMYMFTSGQVTRMRACLNGTRSSLLTSNGCTPSTTYCSGLATTFTAPSGTVTDGSASFNYNDNTNCQWLIQPTGGATSITLTFTTFATESTNDVVRVYNGTSAAGTLVGTYSGSSLPSSLTINGSAMYITFTSNASVNAAGWSANYSAVVPITDCVGLQTYTTSTGTVTDGSGSSNYLNDRNCEFLIQPGGSGTITITFTAFSTESGYDEVTIYDGPNSGYNILGTYSGSTIPSSITTTNNIAYVTFTSDESVTSSGWSFNYTFSGTPPYCQSQTNLTAASGTFSDGSGTSNYFNNTSCKWLIQPSTTAQSIGISFSAFATESSYDYVRIYAGTNTSGTLLASYTGTTLPSSVTVNGSAALVHFTTDNSVTSTGWTINYTSVATGVVGTQLLDGEVEVFPNPAEDVITIRVRLNNSSAVHCKLLNAYGQAIWEKAYNGVEIEDDTNISDLPSGMYYVQVTDENGRTKVEKVIKK